MNESLLTFLPEFVRGEATAENADFEMSFVVMGLIEMLSNGKSLGLEGD